MRSCVRVFECARVRACVPESVFKEHVCVQDPPIMRPTYMAVIICARNQTRSWDAPSCAADARRGRGRAAPAAPGPWKDFRRPWQQLGLRPPRQQLCATDTWVPKPADFVRRSEDHSAWRPREQRLDEPSAAPPRAARAARTPASWVSQSLVEQDASSAGAGGEPRRRTPCAERSAPDDEHRAASAAEGARGPPRAPSPAAAAAAGVQDQLQHSGRAPSPSGP